jgi:hypothetical protein
MPRIRRASAARRAPSRDRHMTLTGLRRRTPSGVGSFPGRALPRAEPLVTRQATARTPSHPENQRPNRSPFRQTRPKTTPRTRRKPKDHTENRPKNR